MSSRRPDAAPPTEATAAPAGDPAGVSDRRARNRARTRRALIDAALGLFSRHGFDDVSVEKIADVAGVSPRTFFRYFPTKEDVVFADYEAEFDAWDTVTSVPRVGESLLDTIRRGAHRVTDDYEADAVRWDAWFDLVTSEPGLQRRMLESQARLRHRATTALAELLGVDPDTDVRPAALAAAAMSATETAIRAWYAAGKPGPRRDVVDRALDQLAELGDVVRCTPPSDGRDRGLGRH